SSERVCSASCRRRSQRCELDPYTTLFRSCGRASRRPWAATASCAVRCGPSWGSPTPAPPPSPPTSPRQESPRSAPSPSSRPRDRSEEHTSELQSRENLVCRLLLEKKKPGL